MGTILRRVAALTLSAATMTTLAGTWPLSAQEPKSSQGDSKSKMKTAKRVNDPARRVPYNFGQLGLSDEQRETIYKIQARNAPKIEALEKQLDALRAESLRECENVLTSAQKQMLAERRGGAPEARVKKSASKSKD